MCIISINYQRKLTDKEITNCFARNSHGIGIGWVEDGKVNYRKGFMTIEAFHEFYDSFERKPHVCHFRLTSSGITTPRMTHPYIVSEYSPLWLDYQGIKPILFHNGHLGPADAVFGNEKFPHVIRHRTWNDSRAVAVMVARHGPDFLKHLYGRFVMLTPEKMIVRGFEKSCEKDGVQFSNWGFMSYDEYGGNPYTSRPISTQERARVEDLRVVFKGTTKKWTKDTVPYSLDNWKNGANPTKAKVPATTTMPSPVVHEVAGNFNSTQDFIDHYRTKYAKKDGKMSYEDFMDL